MNKSAESWTNMKPNEAEQAKTEFILLITKSLDEFNKRITTLENNKKTSSNSSNNGHSSILNRIINRLSRKERERN